LSVFSCNEFGREDSAIVIAWRGVQCAICPKNRDAGISDERDHPKSSHLASRGCAAFF
jgi:hypothetical protein